VVAAFVHVLERVCVRQELLPPVRPQAAPCLYPYKNAPRSRVPVLDIAKALRDPSDGTAWDHMPVKASACKRLALRKAEKLCAASKARAVPVLAPESVPFSVGIKLHDQAG
jgi:hypothetical protein